MVALTGELGAGKTTLVKGLAAGLAVHPASVCSPTFVLVHRYSGRMPLIHADLYRLSSAAEAEAAGLHELADDQSVLAVEWADRIPNLLPADRLEIRLSHQSLVSRTAYLEATGPQSQTWLARIRRQLLLARPARRMPVSRGRRKVASS